MDFIFFNSKPVLSFDIGAWDLSYENSAKKSDGLS